MSSNLPIGNGQNPNKGDRVRAKHIVNLDEKIKRLSRRVTINPQVAARFIDLPFDISVRIKEGTSDPYEYQISAARGIVAQKLSTAAEDVDALLYFEPSNALTDDLPTWFDIATNQSLFVVVTETNTGTARGIASVALQVAASTTESTAYIPAVQDGVYYYELVKFSIVDEMPVIEKWMAGSHIFHEVTDGGWWGTCSFLFTPAGGGGSPTNLIQTFQAGRLVSVSLDGVDQEGTVEVIGDAEWEINV